MKSSALALPAAAAIPTATPAAALRRRTRPAADGRLRALLQDCRNLLSERGEANGGHIARLPQGEDKLGDV